LIGVTGKVPPIFKLIQDVGDINEEEMREVFNMGIGLIFIISKTNAEFALKFAKELNEQFIVVGQVA